MDEELMSSHRIQAIGKIRVGFTAGTWETERSRSPAKTIALNHGRLTAVFKLGAAHRSARPYPRHRKGSVTSS